MCFWSSILSHLHLNQLGPHATIFPPVFPCSSQPTTFCGFQKCVLPFDGICSVSLHKLALPLYKGLISQDICFSSQKPCSEPEFTISSPETTRSDRNPLQNKVEEHRGAKGKTEISKLTVYRTVLTRTFDNNMNGETTSHSGVHLSFPQH